MIFSTFGLGGEMKVLSKYAAAICLIFGLLIPARAGEWWGSGTCSINSSIYAGLYTLTMSGTTAVIVKTENYVGQTGIHPFAVQPYYATGPAGSGNRQDFYQPSHAWQIIIGAASGTRTSQNATTPGGQSAGFNGLFVLIAPPDWLTVKCAVCDQRVGPGAKVEFRIGGKPYVAGRTYPRTFIQKQSFEVTNNEFNHGGQMESVKVELLLDGQVVQEVITPASFPGGQYTVDFGTLKLGSHSAGCGCDQCSAGKITAELGN